MKSVLKFVLAILIAFAVIMGIFMLAGKTEWIPGWNNGETSASGDSTGGDSTGGDSTGGNSTGGDSASGDSTGGDSTGGDSTGGDSTGGASTGGDSTGGDSTGGDTGELSYADFTLPYRHTAEENEGAQNAIRDNDYSAFFRYRDTVRTYEQWHNLYVQYGGEVIDQGNASYCAVYHKGRYSNTYLFTLYTGYSEGIEHTWASWIKADIYDLEEGDNDYNIFITESGNVDFTFEGDTHGSYLMYSDTSHVYHYCVSSDSVSAHTVYFVG